MNETDYKAALEKLKAWMDSNAELNDEIVALIDTIIEYEEEHFPIDPPTPEEAAAFRAEQEGRKDG